VPCISAQQLDAAIDFSESMIATPTRSLLTIHEAAAIHLYTGKALFPALNERLRETAQEKQLQSLQPFLGIARLIQSAMLKLPACGDALVFRGVRVKPNKLDIDYRHGQEFEWGSFTSCSRRADVAEGRGLHSSTFRLSLSAFCGVGGARRGCVARVKGVLGGV